MDSTTSRHAVLIVLVLSMAGARVALAAAGDMQHPDRLAGEMFIAGATLVDPPPGEPADTHAYLSLTGSAARSLFRALKAPEMPDACLPGRKMKSIGPIHCSVGAKPGDARCDFGIDLARGITAPGLVC